MSVKLGFIGVGGIANHHLRVLPQIELAEPVAFCDLAEERAQDAANRFNGRAYTDYRVMLEQADLDAVFICLPPFAHGAPELAVIERGLPFFVEKPVATTLETAQTITHAVTTAGLISSVGYHWRYMDITERAKEILADNPIAIAIGFWMGGLPGVPWWRVREQSGGQTVEQTTHIFDLARYLVGEVKSVYGIASQGLMTDIENYDVDDASTVSLTFVNSAIATIVSACILDRQSYGIGLDLIGRDLILKLHSNSLTVSDGEKTIHYRPQGDPTRREDEAFLQAVQSGDASGIRCSYAEGARTLAVSLAASESFQSGLAVAPKM